MSSNFILNNTQKVEEFEIHPLIHSFSNIFWENSPLKGYKIPDENLIDNLPEGFDMSMVAGEFCEVYNKQLNCWDCIVSCYFIDTANNIIDYIQTIYNILKIGGVWINFGFLVTKAHFYITIPKWRMNAL